MESCFSFFCLILIDAIRESLFFSNFGTGVSQAEDNSAQPEALSVESFLFSMRTVTQHLFHAF